MSLSSSAGKPVPPVLSFYSNSISLPPTSRKSLPYSCLNVCLATSPVQWQWPTFSTPSFLKLVIYYSNWTLPIAAEVISLTVGFMVEALIA